MEQFVFPEPAVAGQLRHFVEARLHSDGKVNEERIDELVDTLARSVAQPIYVVVDPRTEEELGRFEGATLGDPQPFIDFLVEARSKVDVAALER